MEHGKFRKARIASVLACQKSERIYIRPEGSRAQRNNEEIELLGSPWLATKEIVMRMAPEVYMPVSHRIGVERL